MSFTNEATLLYWASVGDDFLVVIISIPIDVMFGEAATNHGNFKIKKHGTTPQLLVTATTPNNQTSIFGIL